MHVIQCHAGCNIEVEGHIIRIDKVIELPCYLVARQTRLFPRDPAIRYEGPVHEEVQASVSALGWSSVDAAVVIHHLGKVRGAAVTARKRQLYRRLGDVENAQRHREIYGQVRDAVDESERTVEALERSRYSYLIKARPLNEIRHAVSARKVRNAR